MKITLKRRHSGFTLVEALVTIGILSVLASLAVPSFTRLIESNRISSASNDFLSALMFARSEAAKRSTPVSICTSDNGTGCSTSLNDYASGWIIFTDCNGDGVLDAATTCDLDGDDVNDPDTLLRVQAEIRETSIVATAVDALDAFTYQFSGRPEGPVGFNIGKDPAEAKKTINVARTGRIRLEGY